MLYITHNAGFFSNCSLRIESIIDYFNKHRVLPAKINSSKQFEWYKPKNYSDINITPIYFTYKYNDEIYINYRNPIDFKHTYQYMNYKSLEYKNIFPFIVKYFSPSAKIKNIIREIEIKYDLDYDNICVLFYRGNDKRTETKLCSYDEMFKLANYIRSKRPYIKFLIQSDETQFIEEAFKRYPDSLIFEHEIRYMNKCMKTVDLVFNNSYHFSKNYLAITIIMSKCKYVICNHSGNCSMWIYFYRNNPNNFFQYLNGKFV